MDVGFVILYLTGIERIQQAAPNAYGDNLIHAYWDHSLVGAALLARSR
jgi:hypothetical protein